MDQTIQTRQWHHTDSKDGLEFLITCDRQKLDRKFVNDAFASDDLPWAKPLPLDQLQMMINNSLNIGLYKVLPSVPAASSASSPSSPRTPSPTLGNDDNNNGDEKLEQVGMARIITDYTTVAYLTDVYVLPEYQGRGLGKWIVACIKDIMVEMPAFRRVVLLTTNSSRFYERELGCYDLRREDGRGGFMTRGPF